MSREREAREPTIDHPVVGAALRTLTNLADVIDRSGPAAGSRRGDGPPSADEGGGHQWEPADVESWALTNGWTEQGAAAFREVAQRVSGGRGPERKHGPGGEAG